MQQSPANTILTALLLSVLALMSACGFSESARRSSVAATVESAVVQIGLEAEDGSFTSMGTGFFVSGLNIITANHVNEALRVNLKGRRKVARIVRGRDRVQMEIFLFESLAPHDMAIFRVTDKGMAETIAKLGVAPLEIDPTPPSIGDDVVVAGFLDDYKGPIFAFAKVNWTSQEFVEVDKNVSISGGFLTDAQTFPGYSGGPVVSTRTGKVVGLEVGRRYNNNSSSAYAVSTFAQPALQVVKRLE